MNKTLTSGLIAMTALLLAGSIWFPNEAIMWLASTTLFTNIVRGILIAVLLVILFTNPPRSPYIRGLFSLSSIILFSLVMIQLQSSVFIFDMMMFSLASVIFAIEALEYNPEEGFEPSVSNA